MKAPLILLSIISTFLFSCSSGASFDDKGENDSIFTVENITRQAMVAPQAALALLDSAEASSKMSIIDINGLRSMIYHNALDMSNVALVYANQVYSAAVDAHDTVAMIKSLKHLVGLNFIVSHYYQALNYANRGLELIADDDARSQAFFLLYVGHTKAETESVDAGLEYFDRSIDIYRQISEQSGRSGDADDYLYACMQKANALQAANRFKDALAVLPLCNDAFEALTRCEDAIPALIDHRHAELLSVSMIVYHQCGFESKATDCYMQYKATAHSKTPGGSDLVIPYLIASQQYDEALARLDIEQSWFAAKRDTVSEYYVNTVLASRLQCLKAKGQWPQALALSNRIKSLTDSIYKRENAHQMAEQSIIYKTKDYELQMIAQQQKLSEQRAAIIVGIVVLAIVFALLVVLFYYNRKIRRKNRASATLIDELSASHSIQIQSIIKQPEPKIDASADDSQLFTYLNRRIVSQKLYLQQNFHREDAASLIGVPVKHLSAIFRQFANGFPGYINDLRLEHSVDLLKTKNNYTIEGIAQECGFSNRQTFHRLFLEKYGMTPAEFRAYSSAKS